MFTTHDEHERLLRLVQAQRWTAFSSEDEGLLKAFVYAGLLAAERLADHPGKVRLMLTDPGERYLAELQGREHIVRVPSPVTPQRRFSDLDPMR